MAVMFDCWNQKLTRIENGFNHGAENVIIDGRKQDIIALASEVSDAVMGGADSPKGLIGHEFEDYLTQTIGGNGSFSVGGRDFDGGVGNRWWESKSGQYWDMITNDANKLSKFKSEMGERLRIAKENGATYELFSNTPIPDEIKVWLTQK